MSIAESAARELVVTLQDSHTRKKIKTWEQRAFIKFPFCQQVYLSANNSTRQFVTTMVLCSVGATPVMSLGAKKRWPSAVAVLGRSWVHKSVRSFQISGNSTTSSILCRQLTPPVPPVPRLTAVTRSTVVKWRKRQARNASSRQVLSAETASSAAAQSSAHN